MDWNRIYRFRVTALGFAVWDDNTGCFKQYDMVECRERFSELRFKFPSLWNLGSSSYSSDGATRNAGTGDRELGRIGNSLGAWSAPKATRSSPRIGPQ